MSCVCLKSETLCSIWCFCSNASSLSWKPFPRCHTTCQVQEDDSQVLQVSLRKLQGSQWKPSADAHQMLALHPCGGVAARGYPRAESHHTLLTVRGWGVMAVLDRGLCSSEAWNTDSYLSMSGTNPKDHYNHVRLKCFLIALLVIN